jgi:uncharacterized protein DUF3500
MAEETKVACPECASGPVAALNLDRRGFIRVVGQQVAVAGAVGFLTRSKAGAAEAKTPAARPAEELVKELHAGLTAEQKAAVVLPFNHGAADGKGMPTRLGMYNAPILARRIGQHYTPAQQELVGRILRATCSDDEGYRRITRNHTFDGSGSLQGCGALLFGAPADGQDWSWVFSGHHLTVRCDGKPKDGVGFGGPMYYGHSPNGYSDKNVFFFQTQSVLRVFDALDERQRKLALVSGSPGEQAPSVRFRAKGQPRPGLGAAELSKDQKELVEKVMRDLLSPYRKDDADEVMEVLKETGGLEKIHLAFYKNSEDNDKQPWHFWRLEGPGFIWNFRVLPHVHTYVNISSKV